VHGSSSTVPGSRASPADYAPARWLPGPHAMTVYAAVSRPLPRLPMRRERWELPDGDFLDLDRLDASAAGAPVLVVCHGLEGSSRAPYVRGLAARARALGLAVVALNFRSCSGEANRLPRFYHSGDTADLGLVVDRLAAEQPGRAVLLAGFSLGGNVVVKYLGERGESVPREVAGAAVVSVPFDLARCARALDGPGPWNRLYRTRFLVALRAKALAKDRRFPGLLDREAVRAARTFAAFDGAVTAPLHGFRSAEEYWARSSSGPFVGGVRRPLLAISSLDDPLVPADTLPLEAARANALVTFLATPGGGHVGFVAGTPLARTFFAEERAAAFLSQLGAPGVPGRP
jgi:predicted alpha/beta-fold hydrolase